ncbi:MAG: hypothetical protein HY365_02655 [Candidatus Aenigmarchaeota archaeon]|nr:hypothetical protein [Candidatus Aenigmarchaeota archaeon]
MVELLNPYLSAAKGIAEALKLNKAALTGEDPVARIEAAYEIRWAAVRYHWVLDHFQQLTAAEASGDVRIPYDHELMGFPDPGIQDNAYQLLAMALEIKTAESPMLVLTGENAPRFND